jgi:hypothetical protein
MLQVFNIVFFFSYLGFALTAPFSIPNTIDVSGAHFIDFHPAVRAKIW